MPTLLWADIVACVLEALMMSDKNVLKRVLKKTPCCVVFNVDIASWEMRTDAGYRTKARLSAEMDLSLGSASHGRF